MIHSGTSSKEVDSMTYEQLIEKIQIQIDMENDVIRGIENNLLSVKFNSVNDYNSLLNAYAASKMIVEVLEKLLKE